MLSWVDAASYTSDFLFWAQLRGQRSTLTSLVLNTHEITHYTTELDKL